MYDTSCQRSVSLSLPNDGMPCIPVPCVMIQSSSLIEETATEAGGRRRYYRLSRTGRAVLKAEVARMEAVVRLAANRKLAPQGGS